MREEMPLKKRLDSVIDRYKNHPEFIGIDIADPNQAGAVDDTLLHIAARKGDLEAIDVLIASGAQINIRGDLGNTPLHQAAMRGQVESVKKLLSLGADLSVKNEYDQTALDVAMIGGHQSVVEILKANISS